MVTIQDFPECNILQCVLDIPPADRCTAAGALSSLYLSNDDIVVDEQSKAPAIHVCSSEEYDSCIWRPPSLLPPGWAYDDSSDTYVNRRYGYKTQSAPPIVPLMWEVHVNNEHNSFYFRDHDYN